MSHRHERWVRFCQADVTGFGTLDGDVIHVHAGDMFEHASPTGDTLALDAVQLRMPVQPGKVIALWNNFGALGRKLGLGVPLEPLYLLKAPNSFAHPGDLIRAPRCPGKVLYEGELGIVIGRSASGVSEAEAMDHVFGYTCANDVTLGEILHRDASFAQWVRAKGFDTFCPLGPAIATGLDARTLSVRTTLNGHLRQDFPITDMLFPVERLVSLISADMTLLPGDVILCGTSVGVGAMKPDSEVTVEIAGIGALTNRFG